MIRQTLDFNSIADILLIASGLFLLYRTLLRLGTWKIVAGIGLAMSIFDPNFPGHDGALFVRNGKFSHFGVRLPISQTATLPPPLGTMPPWDWPKNQMP